MIRKANSSHLMPNVKTSIAAAPDDRTDADGGASPGIEDALLTFNHGTGNA